MKEKLVIIFVALVSGLLLTTIVFYIYQTSKTIPQNINSKKVALNNPTDVPKTKIILTIDEPKNESIVITRSVQVKGKTNPENTIIISSNLEDIVATPTSEGNFAVTLDIDAGVNKIRATSIAPSGDQAQVEKTITYSTEDF